MKKIVFDPHAIQDIAESVIYYNREQAGVGFRFRDDVRKTTNKIIKRPDLYTYVEKPFRAYRMQRLHHTIYYHDSREILYILAVLHQSRHPDLWKARIKKIQ